MLALPADPIAQRLQTVYALLAQGKSTDAWVICEELIQMAPTNIDLLRMGGAALHALGRPKEAIEWFEKALAQAPEDLQTIGNLGVALAAAGRVDEAAVLHRKVLASSDFNALNLVNLSVALGGDQKNRLEAMSLAALAVSIDPDYAAGHGQLGTLLYLDRLLVPAERHLRRSIGLDPSRAMDEVTLGLNLLAGGNYREGMIKLEARWRAGLVKPPFKPNELEWTGQMLSGKRFLVYPEQGLGDVIQTCRVVHELANRGAQVILATQPEVMELFQSLRGVSQFVHFERETFQPPPCDLHAPLFTLVGRFYKSPQELPVIAPYLSIDPKMIEHWRAKLPEKTVPRIAFVWRGNPKHTHDDKRSCSVREFAPLLEMSGISFVSLQQKLTEEEKAFLDGYPNVLQIGDELENFAHSGAVLKNCDLLISVDSSPVHLAGALNLPVWNLVAFIADWRWGLAGETTPWYQSMRILRQKTRMDWPELMGRVKTDLAAFVAGRGN